MDNQHPFRSHFILPLEHPVQPVDPYRTFSIGSQVDVRLVALGALVIALAVNLIAPWIFDVWARTRYYNTQRYMEMAGGFMFGLKLSELMTLGFVLGIGSWHIAQRILYVGGATLLLTAGLVIGFQVMKIPLEITVLLFIASIIIVSLLGLGVWGLAWISNWRLVRVSQRDREKINDLPSSQFNTRFLFKTMLAVAVGISLLKFCVSISARGIGPPGAFPWLAAVAWLSWLAVGITIYSIVQSIAFLVPKAWGWRIAFGIFVIVGPGFLQWIGSSLVGGSMFAFRLDREVLWMTYLVSFGFAIGSSLFFLVLRIMGFHLRKLELSQESSA